VSLLLLLHLVMGLPASVLEPVLVRLVMGLRGGWSRATRAMRASFAMAIALPRSCASPTTSSHTHSLSLSHSLRSLLEGTLL
jgi:hypothetical protein